MPGQLIVNCEVKSIKPTVSVFESVLLAKLETRANSFHEIKKAKINGVKIFAYSCKVNNKEISVNKKIKVKL